MTQYVVYSGTTSSGLVLGGGDTLVISGGTVLDLTISNGGVNGVVVKSGGVLSGGTIAYGTNANISSGGLALGVTANNAGLEVYSGGVASGSLIITAAHLDIYNGGTASSTVVSGGGEVLVSSGGTATGTMVGSGGWQIVDSGGMAFNATVSVGGVDYVAGGTETGAIIQGEQNIVVGSVYNTTVDAGATMYVSGGIADNTTVGVGAHMYIEGGTASGVTAVGASVPTDNGLFLARVEAFSNVSGVTLNDGDLEVYAGATAYNVTATNGSYIVFSGPNYLNGSTIAAIVSGSNVSDNSVEDIFGGGISISAIIGAAGQLNLSVGTASGTIVQSGGSEFVSSGGIDSQTSVRSGGQQVVSSGGAATSTTVYAGGSVAISSGGSASADIISNGGIVKLLAGGSAISTTVSSGGLEVIYAGGTASGTTLLAGGVIDVVSGVLTYTSGGTASWNASTDILTVTEGSTTYTQQLTGNYAADDFQLSADGTGGTEITLCFLTGTHIATPAGEVAVEDLAAGDLVLTSGGAAQPVIWLGRSTVSSRFADPQARSPIRIKAGALGEGLPVRDLLVSPHHALFLEGILVHANALVNGMSIIRETDLPEFFTYFHVELATHELLISEGVPSESFVDNVDRMNFDNWDEHEALFGNKIGIVEMPYPRAKAARQIPSALCKALAERAAQICAIPLCA